METAETRKHLSYLSNSWDGFQVRHADPVFAVALKLSSLLSIADLWVGSTFPMHSIPHKPSPCPQLRHSHRPSESLNEWIQAHAKKLIRNGRNHVFRKQIPINIIIQCFCIILTFYLMLNSLTMPRTFQFDGKKKKMRNSWIHLNCFCLSRHPVFTLSLWISVNKSIGLTLATVRTACVCCCFYRSPSVLHISYAITLNMRRYDIWWVQRVMILQLFQQFQLLIAIPSGQCNEFFTYTSSLHTNAGLHFAHSKLNSRFNQPLVISVHTHAEYGRASDLLDAVRNYRI